MPENKKPEIKINDLRDQPPAGSELFEEKEGYMDNLSEEELNVRGGQDEISISAGDYVSTGENSDISIGDLE